MKKYFKLYACCIPVKGASISLICDIQRFKFHYIPNELYEILKTEKIHLKAFLNKYENEERETLKEYFDFLIDEEYAMITESPELFPNIDTSYITPHYIDNAIIDFSASSKHKLNKILLSLNSLGCKHLEMRFFEDISLHKLLDEILPNFKDTRLRGVKLYIKYSKELNNEIIYENIIKKYSVILDIIIHSSPFNKRVDKEIKYSNILYISEVLSSEKHCGIIGLEYFSINFSTFFESLKYNSCLNRKLSIDSKGLIKNCPSLESNYGSHENIKIEDIVRTKKFQEVWGINKDLIDTCKDCQFRYICTDCRAYTDNPNNIYAKPLKCGYNPYTNKWEEWSENPLKQKSIEYYGMQKFLNIDD